MLEKRCLRTFLLETALKEADIWGSPGDVVRETEMVGACRISPLPGDVVVSRGTNHAHYYVSVIPEPPQILSSGRGDAERRARAFATRAAVDAWYTDDHSSFVALARHRPQS